MTLKYHGHRLLLRLTDDGTGFAASGVENGHGLASMRRRVTEISSSKLRQSPGAGPASRSRSRC